MPAPRKHLDAIGGVHIETRRVGGHSDMDVAARSGHHKFMTPELKFLVVVAYLAAMAFVFWAARTAVQWSTIRGRPVMTCAEFATAMPGLAVVVVGRTAAGPMLAPPHGHIGCVAYQSVSTHTHVVSDNYQETTRTVNSERGDTGLYGADGARVVLAERIRMERLIGDRAMMFAGAGFEHRDNTKIDQRSEQDFIVPADQAVVAAGVVAAVDGHPSQLFLDRGSWLDGSVQGSIENLSGMFARRIVANLISALAFVGVAILLSRLG